MAVGVAPWRYVSMRRARATSASDARNTPPRGTGCSGSSGSWRSTAAVQRRISWRTVGLSAARAGSPSAPTTSCRGDARSEYAKPSGTTPKTPLPVSRFFHAHDRPDADRRLGGGPEVELVRSGGLELGRDDPPDRLGQPRLNHDAARGTRGMRCGRKSRGARALRYVSTSWIG